MAVGVLIITHEGIGDALLATACSVFPDRPIAIRSFSVARDVDTDQSVRGAIALADEVQSGDGVLVLSDLFGSTPGNVAKRVTESIGGRLVSGVNLPMLLRVFNYSTLPLEQLKDKAVEGGRAGVVG